MITTTETSRVGSGGVTNGYNSNSLTRPSIGGVGGGPSSLPRSNTPQNLNNSNTSGNLSELDTLLQDLSSARYSSQIDKGK